MIAEDIAIRFAGVKMNRVALHTLVSEIEDAITAERVGADSVADSTSLKNQESVHPHRARLAGKPGGR